MDAGTVEGALVMRDLASQVIAHVEKSLQGLTDTLAKTGDAAEKAGTTVATALSTKLKAVGSELRSIGQTATLALTVPLTGAGVAAVAMAKNFETSMTKIETLAAVSRKQVDEWKASVLGLSGEIGKGPQELADSLFAIASAGNRGAEALDVLKQAGMASAIGLGNTETISRALVGTLAAYKDSGLTAAQATNVLIATVQEGNVEADELAGTLGRVVGIAATAGVSFQELGGFLATFTRLGVDSAEAVTALRGLLSTLIKPSSDAREELQALGLSVEQLRSKVKEQGLTQAMIELADATKGNLDAIGSIIPNVRALAGFLGTAGVNAADFAQVTKTVTAAMNDADFTTGKFARTTETVAYQWDAFKAKLQVAALELGGKLLPAAQSALDALKPLAQALVDAARGFAALPQPVQTATLAFVGVAAALGPLIFLIGNVTTAVGGLIGAWGKLAKSEAVISGINAMKSAIVGIGTAAAESSIAVGAITAAAAGIVVGAGIVLLVEWINRVREAYQNLIDAGNLVGHSMKVQSEAVAVLTAHQAGLRGEQLKNKDITLDQAKAWEIGAQTAGKLATATSTTSATIEGFGKAAKDAAPALKNVGLTLDQAAAMMKVAGGSAGAGAIQFKATIGGLGAATAAAGPKIATMSDALRQAQAQLAALTPAMRQEIADGLKMGMGAKDIADEFARAHPQVNLTANAVELFKDSLQAATEAAKAGKKDLQEYVDTLNSLSGQSATKAAALTSAALGQIKGGIDALGLGQLEDAKKAFDEYFASLGRGAPANSVFVTQAEQVGKAIAKLKGEMQGAHVLVVQPWLDLADAMMEAAKAARARELSQAKDAVDAVARSVEKTGAALEAVRAVQDKVADDRWLRSMPPGWEKLAAVALQYRDALSQISDFQLGDQADAMRAAVQASFEGMVADASISAEQIAAVFGSLAKRFPDLFPKGLPLFGGAKPSGKTVAPGLLDYVQTGLGPDILGAVKGGGSVLGTIGAGVFGQLFKVTDKAKGIAGGAIGDLLKKGTDKIGSVLGGTVGKAFGSIIPVVGPLLGEGLGKLAGAAFGKLFGAEAKQTKSMREDFLKQAGGLAEVQKMAEYAGVSIDKLMSTKKTKEFNAEVQKLEAAFKATQQRVQALAGDMDKIIQKGGVIPVDMWKRILSDKDKDEIRTELAKVFDDAISRVARGFNRIAANFLALTTLDTSGIKAITDELEKARKEGHKPLLSEDFVAALPDMLHKIGPLAEAAFGALIESGMSAVEAIQALEPGLAQIQDVLDATGVHAEGAIAQLLGFREVINQHKELFEVLGGVDDMLTGLANSGLLTQEVFDSLAGLISDSYRELTVQGVSAEDALRLMQPQLQKLWELEQDFGFTVDETTQSMLDQASASGIVGDAFRSASDRMVRGIDKMVERLDALLQGLGIKIPEAAGKAGKAIEDSIPDDITIGIHWKPDQAPEIPGGQNPAPIPMASGGDWVVSSPTLFLAGEAGPERATFSPIGGGDATSGGDGGGMLLPVRIELEGYSVAEALVRVFKRAGVV